MKKKVCSLLALLLVTAMLCGAMAGCGSPASSAAGSTASAAEASASAASEVSAASEPAEAASEASADSAAEASAPAEEASAAEGSEAASTEEAADGEVVLTPVDLPIVEEEVHYSCWMPMAPYVSELINLDNFSEEIAIVKLINEATNVHIDFEAVPGGPGEDEKFNLMIAAADYTDIIGIMSRYSTGLDGAIEDDVIIDLRDDLEEYAPNYMNLLKSDEKSYLNMITEDGAMGCIAQMLKKGGTENSGMIIRKDWLEEAGLEIPTTFDEMEEYLTYCKDNYGAYAYIQYEGKDTDWGSAFNVTPGGYNVIDGEVVHSYTTQAFQDYLAQMNKWYSMGMFNDDFYNDTDITTVRSDMANNMCSFVDGSAENMSMIYDQNLDGHELSLMGMPYLKADGVDEIHVGFESSVIKNADTWAVSTACGDHTALLQLVNWLYSEEGQILYNWGEEGVSFEYDENGDPQWTDLVVNNPENNFMFASYLYATGVGSVYFPGVYDMEKGFYSYNQDQLDAVDIFASLTDGEYNIDRGVSLTLDEQTENASLESEMSTYADGEIIKFITGDRSLDTYDEFLSECENMGLTRMTEIQQQAYDRYLEKLG